MIGYPGTQLISDEIAKTVGETDEEVDYLSTRIGTAYVISGFTSVNDLFHHRCQYHGSPPIMGRERRSASETHT